MEKIILVVEDETSLRETIVYNLEKEGHRVISVDNGLDAVKMANQEHPNLILMDIMLPGIDGVEATRAIRKSLSTPILMLTAKADEVDKVLGLEMGADDYLTKPFSMRELMARVKAQLRRSSLYLISPNIDGMEQGIQSENISMNLNRHEVTINTQKLDLKPKEFELLRYLMTHKGQVLTREQILKSVWGWEYVGETRTVDVHIRWLREKIEIDSSEPIRIITVHSIGYRFEG